jgi:hypothetical protein
MNHFRWIIALLAFGLLALFVFPASAASTERPFDRSGIVTENRRTLRAPAGGTLYPAAPIVASPRLPLVTVGANVNVVDTNDVVQQSNISGKNVKTCDPGKQTAQNEMVIAVNPNDANNLVAGMNDYRLYEPTERRYDGSGGFYRSTNGGANWAAGFLPGLVLGNTTDPGPYQSAGDPAVVAGPSNVFWYSNIVFNRDDNANGIAVSRSVDGGANWTTNFVVQTSAAKGAKLFNDKAWIAADPNDGMTAYETWTEFHMDSNGNVTKTPIVWSKTTDGGAHWTAPAKVTSNTYNQGSVVWVDTSGTVHVVWEASTFAGSQVAYASKTSSSSNFGATQFLATVNDVPDPFSWSQFRTNSFPGFALDGSKLHVIWSNWNGSNADILYIRSTNSGTSWSSPVTIGGGASDQFYPWVGANNGNVFVSYLDHKDDKAQRYHVSLVASSDHGAHWTVPVTVSTKDSNPAKGNRFGFPNCAPDFIGDYTGIAVGSDAVAHPLWMDIRKGNSPGDPVAPYDQDAFTARVTNP